MHLVYNNSKTIYDIKGKDSKEVGEDSDLGVIEQQDLKWNKQ